MDYFWTLISRVVLRAGAFFTLLLLARVLTSSELGVYGIVTTASFFIIYVGSLGMRHALAYDIGKANILTINVLSFILFISSLLSFFCVTLAVSFYYFHFNFESDLIFVSALMIFPMMFLYVSQGFFLGSSDLKSFNFYEVLPRFITLFLVAVTMFFYEINLLLAVTFTTFGFTCSAALTMLKLYRSLNFKFSIVRLSDFSRMAAYGVPFSAAMASTMFIPLSVMYVMEGELEAQAIGVFFLAYKLVDIFGEAATAAGMVSFSKVVSSASGSKAFNRSIRLGKLIVVISLFTSSAIAMLPDVFYVYFLGESYKGVGDLVTLLSFGLPFICFNRIMNPALSAIGHPSIGLYSQLTSLVLNLVLCLVVVSPFGVTGCAISIVISRVFAACVFAHSARSLAGVSYHRMFFPSGLEIRFILLSTKKLCRLIVRRII